MQILNDRYVRIMADVCPSFENYQQRLERLPKGRRWDEWYLNSTGNLWVCQHHDAIRIMSYDEPIIHAGVDGTVRLGDFSYSVTTSHHFTFFKDWFVRRDGFGFRPGDVYLSDGQSLIPTDEVDLDWLENLDDIVQKFVWCHGQESQKTKRRASYILVGGESPEVRLVSCGLREADAKKLKTLIHKEIEAYGKALPERKRRRILNPFTGTETQRLVFLEELAAVEETAAVV